MTDFEMLSFGMFMGAISLMVFIGLGVYIDDRRNNRANQGELVTDPTNDIHIHGRNRSGSSNNRCFEQMDSETLATYIRAMILTGICPSNTEKQCLEEAASRIERSKA